MMGRALAVGIDLGTTQSYLAYKPLDGGDYPRLAKCHPEPTGPEDDENPGAWAAMPSRVLLSRQAGPGNTFVLRLDSKSEALPPTEYTTIVRFKQLFGQSRKLQELPEYRVERVTDTRTSKALYARPEGIAAFLIWRMLRLAVQTVPGWQDAEIKQLTITVPALSKVSQRRITQFAARVAGFHGEIHTLEEPVAAFLYHLDRLPEVFEGLKERFVLVFDFGGGTCDVSMIKFTPGQLPRVVARQAGQFGGETIDDLIVKRWLLEVGPKSNRITAEELTPQAREAVRLAARKAKESLVHLDVSPRQKIAYLGGSDQLLGNRTLSRTTLNAMLNSEKVTAVFNGLDTKCDSVMELITKLVDGVIRRAKVSEREIGAVILAGGSSKLESVRLWMESKFNWLPHARIIRDSPEACIAKGAAIHQFYRQHRDRSKKEMITVPLASEIRLDHSYNSQTGNWGGSEILAPEDSDLPLIRGGILNSKWVEGVKKYEGKVRVRLVQGGDEADPLLDEFIEVGGRRVARMQLAYVITEDGVIDDFWCKPFWLTPDFTPPWAQLRRKGIAQGELSGLLKEYDLSDTKRIRTMRSEYGILLDEN